MKERKKKKEHECFIGSFAECKKYAEGMTTTSLCVSLSALNRLWAFSHNPSMKSHVRNELLRTLFLFFFFSFFLFFVLRGKEDKDVCDLRTTSQWVVVMKWRSKRDDKLCQRDVKTTSHSAESCQRDPIYIYIYVYVIISLSGEPRKEKEKKKQEFFFLNFHSN